MLMVEFWVPGVPKPKGSKTPMKSNSGKVFVIEGKASQRPAIKAWDTAVNEAAVVELNKLGEQITGPIRIDVAFRFIVPKVRRKQCEAAGGWLPKITKPDLDKLIRATWDPLKTAGLISDDSIAWVTSSSKVEVLERGGALITIIQDDGSAR